MSCDHELANEWVRCSGKNASYITIIIVSIPTCYRIQLPYLVHRLTLELYTRVDSSGCVELLQILQLEISSLNSKKRKMIKPIWKRKAYFSVEMFSFCSLRLTIKCNRVLRFGLYRKYKEETEGFQKQLNTSLHVILNSSNSHLLQIKILVSHTRTWNCGMQSPHINEHGNLCITTITISPCN